MNKVIIVLIMFLVSSCEEKDWTDDPKYDPKPNSLLRF